MKTVYLSFYRGSILCTRARSKTWCGLAKRSISAIRRRIQKHSSSTTLEFSCSL